ncbi:MAG: DUF4331 domain-containing protein [Acidobacteriota bacterium]|nr:DUF4331 domain-containing protein [Acidobacteriota bacterium]
MIFEKNKKFAFGALVLTLALALQLMPPTRTGASDHIDGPQLAHDHASDINDMYFFLDPNDNTKVVMVMTINPFLISSEIIGQALFDHNLRYRFEIENTGNAEPDLFIDVRFTRGVGRETGPQTATITLPNGRTFTAPTNVPTQGADTNDIEPPALNVTNDSMSGASFFAGVSDDPFFLDNTAANRYVLSSVRNPGNPNRAIWRNRAGFNAPDGSDPNIDHQRAGQLPGQARNRGLDQGPGRDTYAGFNTLTIAVSVPVASVRGPVGHELGLNGATQRQQTQTVRTDGQVVGSGPFITVDREGNPLVNNGLIPPARKDEYNGAPTTADASGVFRTDITQALQNFGTNATNINILLNMIQVRGDIIRLDFLVPNNGPGGGSNPNGGRGGRRLQDDVVDATFTLINNNQPLGDFVDRNEFEFGNTFPFVAPQIMPNPNGINSRDTRIRL